MKPASEECDGLADSAREAFRSRVPPLDLPRFLTREHHRIHLVGVAGSGAGSRVRHANADADRLYRSRNGRHADPARAHRPVGGRDRQHARLHRERRPAPILPALAISDCGFGQFRTAARSRSASGNTGPRRISLRSRDQGTGAGQIGISGSNVTYGGTTIGTFTGGANGSIALVTFNNASATPAAAQALADHILYANTSDDPSTAPRTVTFTVNDGGGDTGTATATISVTAVNDAPTIAGDKSITVTQGSPWSC